MIESIWPSARLISQTSKNDLIKFKITQTFNNAVVLIYSCVPINLNIISWNS